jgi:hypothetical protein
MTLWRSVLISVCVVLGTLSGVSAQSATYEVVDLIKAHESPEFEVQGHGAVAISDSGIIVGFTGQSATKSNPFYTVDGKPNRVKTGEFGATFTDVNSDGTIVGREVTGRNENGTPIGVPAMWVDEEITRLEIPLDPLGGAFLSGRANGINEAGQIVGEVIYEGDDNQHVVVWTEGVPTLLQGAYGYPFCEGPGISETGNVGGACWNPDAQMYQPTVWIAGVPQWIDAQPGYESGMSAIADTETGYVMVGLTYNQGETLTEANATVLTNGVSTWLPSPDGFPACSGTTVAQTSAGLLVGGVCSLTPGELNVDLGTGMAVAWLDGELIDLDAATGNDGEWTFLTIDNVNAEGQMVGLGERNGERRSFVLNPVP